eukprot:gnl/MRDRNA2_/MRDRNA2_79886_c0_seq3.p1 gnl/MRDRNA2_/MRDRNA2_79886_c0~~gnl/MRDRNA2_/MRDRNA2_79886_c0_seq3.p1  ORF type:complete len:407 (-),score=63.79 gnl/MRDRNA2_/MRDRNA2_79886_c0_seq3:213-1409(-)
MAFQRAFENGIVTVDCRDGTFSWEMRRPEDLEKPAEIAWTNDSAGVCTGAYGACGNSSVEQCTGYAFGPCATSSSSGRRLAQTSSMYTETSFDKLMLVKDELNYLSGGADLSIDVPMSEVENNGYVDKTTYAGSNYSYSYVMAGAFFGQDPVNSGFYMGCAQYHLMKGSIETQLNNFWAATTPGQVATAAGGAPNGPYAICISEISGGECGAARTFSTGAYKFSLFGYTRGDSYSAVADVTYVAFRMKFKMVGMTGALVTFNGGTKTLDDIGSDNITDILITAGGKQFNMSFPQKYNVGSIGAEGPELGTTHDVKIKIYSTAATREAMFFYIDYLFEYADLNTVNKYFVYDPTIGFKEPSTSGDSMEAEASGAYLSVQAASSKLLMILAFLVAYNLFQ